MLHPEQIRNLKHGDPIVIHTTIDRVDSDGDARFLTPNICGDDSHAYINIEYVSLPGEPDEQPKPKHAPTRLFKKGDRVKPAERHGRKTPKLNYKAEYTVTSSEDDYGAVGVEYFTGAMTVSVTIPFYWLELVTPVEELKPYNVVDAHTHWDVADKNMKTVATYSKATHPHAKEAAEAECDRLNAEWRKEQNND